MEIKEQHMESNKKVVLWDDKQDWQAPSQINQLRKTHLRTREEDKAL